MDRGRRELKPNRHHHHHYENVQDLRLPRPPPRQQPRSRRKAPPSASVGVSEPKPRSRSRATPSSSSSSPSGPISASEVQAATAAWVSASVLNGFASSFQAAGGLSRKVSGSSICSVSVSSNNKSNGHGFNTSNTKVAGNGHSQAYYQNIPASTAPVSKSMHYEDRAANAISIADYDQVPHRGDRGDRGVPKQIDLSECCAKVKVCELRQAFEADFSCIDANRNENLTPNPSSKDCKSNGTRVSDNWDNDDADVDDWDFLTTLNEVLNLNTLLRPRPSRPEEKLTNGKNGDAPSVKTPSVPKIPSSANTTASRPPLPRQGHSQVQTQHHAGAGAGLRRVSSDRSLKSTKSRSMDVDQVLIGHSTSSARPCFGVRPNSPVPAMCVSTPTNSCLNNLSASLDSIYDTLHRDRDRCGRRHSVQVPVGKLNISPSPSSSPPRGGHCYDQHNQQHDTDNTENNVPFFVNLPKTAGANQHQLVFPFARLSPSPSRSLSSLKGSLLGLDYEDRLLRLESDKDRLHIHVACLTDQIESQTSKIGDLEKILDDKRSTLECTEDNLQRELLTRSTLETQKLELLTEISSLRLRQASLERENIELKDRYRLWGKPPTGGSVAASSPLLNSPDYATGAGSHMNGSANTNSSAMAATLSRIRLDSTGSEIGVGVGGGNSMAALARSRPRTPPANAFRRVEHSAFGTLPRRTPPSQAQLSIFNGYSQCQGQGQGQGQGGQGYNYNVDVAQLLQQHYNNGGGGGGVGSRGASLSSGNLHAVNVNNHAANERDGWQRRNSGPSFISTKIVKSPPPPLPSNNAGIGAQPKSKSSGFLKLFGKLRRSNSGGLEKDAQNTNTNTGGGGGAAVAPLERNPFVRGGMARSTAAPRLGWGVNSNTNLGGGFDAPEFVRKPNGPVTSWDSDAVIVWFNWLGLGGYSNEVGRWVKSGQQLLDATPHEVEKELGVKNPMHRKKLILALQALRRDPTATADADPGGKLDYHWVIRWLDDIGLPQYKEFFAEARVDGRVLNCLTPDDLIYLKVSSLLHHASIKRAIQLLRIHKFHPNCLCRRGEISPLSNGNGRGGHGHGPKHVATWTNHRVMEWLRAIDLAEYAPNMRGSGVHGALIIFEPKFNAELLSTLLSIPGNKTLLRRHLSLQVNELVGKRLVQEKRAVELAAEFIPISPALKVKPTKQNKGFLLRRKRWTSGGATTTGEELLCPLDLSVYPFEFEGPGSMLMSDSPSPSRDVNVNAKYSPTTPTADIIGSSKNGAGDNEKVSNI